MYSNDSSKVYFWYPIGTTDLSLRKKRKFYPLVHFTKMALHKSSVPSKRIEALKVLANNESSEEEEETKAQTSTKIVAEAKATNKE